MVSERVALAQRAYDTASVQLSKQAHTIKAISVEQHQLAQGQYIKDMVYGASDGIVTTFAVVAGVSGAALSPAIVLIMGFANLFGDGLSMGIGNYLGTKSEQEYVNKEKERESWEIEHYPEGEINEVKVILGKKGFVGKQLDEATKVITSDKKVWVETMMRDELGIVEDDRNPLKAGIATLVAFIIAGLVPMISYLLARVIPSLQQSSFLLACILTGFSLFAVGSARSLVIAKKWYIAGIEMMLLGGVAAAVSYLAGHFVAALA